MIGNISVGQQFDGMTALLQIIADPQGAAAFLADAKATLAATKAAAEEGAAAMKEAEGKLAAAEAKAAEGARALDTAARLAKDNARDAADLAKREAALERDRAAHATALLSFKDRMAAHEADKRAFDDGAAKSAADLVARALQLAADQQETAHMKSDYEAKLAQLRALISPAT